MDLRTLIKMAPAMFRGPLTGLLDRLERVERIVIVRHEDAITALTTEIQKLRDQLAELRKT